MSNDDRFDYLDINGNGFVDRNEWDGGQNVFDRLDASGDQPADERPSSTAAARWTDFAECRYEPRRPDRAVEDGRGRTRASIVRIPTATAGLPRNEYRGAPAERAIPRPAYRFNER